jgi:hypothetical protein
MRAMHGNVSPGPLVLATSALALKLAGTFVMQSHGMTYALRLSLNFVVTLIGLVLAAMAMADALQSAAGLWIPISNSGGHRAVLFYAWPLGHALRCLRSRISSHRPLANVFPRFFRPERLFYGGLGGDRRCRITRAGQTGSVRDSSLGTSIQG